MLGTVYKSTGSWYKVKLENGEFVDCKLFGKFRKRPNVPKHPQKAHEIKFEPIRNQETQFKIIKGACIKKIDTM